MDEPCNLLLRGGMDAVSIERVFVFGDFMGYLFIIRWICAVTREEFCLVTGLRFGVENRKEYDTQANLPFRRCVFPSHLDEQPITGIDIVNAIVGPTFAELYDDEAVGLYCLGILQLVLLGVESRRNVPEWLLRIANDRVAWKKYPWGSYVWPTLYSQLRNTNVRLWGPLYVDQPTNEDDSTTYSIFGYTWAFKTRILESFRVTVIRILMVSIGILELLHGFVEQKIKLERNRKDVDDIKEEMLKFREEMNARPVRQENTVPINVGQHYGFSDFSQFQSMRVPSHIGRPNFQTTIKTQHYVDGIVDQVRRGNYTSTWHPIGWLSVEHMNSWMELLIRRRNAKANWTVAYTGTISVHSENNRFIIPTDQHVIGTLDGTMRPYPAWNDVDWVFMPIHVVGNHWATGVIHLPNSHFYMFDSMYNEQNKDVIATNSMLDPRG
nr:phospholipase-like protein [Tanacetum cinerariifolium]